MTESLLIIEKTEQVGKIQLNRPQVLNALNTALVRELADVMEQMDQDDDIRCILLTGNDKAFAAGADIGEMAEATSVDFIVKPFFADWDRIRKISKPIIAAVDGFALGGGCELAMCCDIIVASETARFGQPEINLGVIPGAGGTQRLTRAVGKVRAMEMILTGKPIPAQVALELGLINRVVPSESLEEEAFQLAKEIAGKPPLAVRLAKQAVLKAMDLPLEHGLHFEQHSFYLLFSSDDQREGMRAFQEKRKPDFKGK
ncbi:enoyl-CoA hydratase-related protein [Paenactinomyces guangxiensis]|uniref:Probable enoyl-CoA hydratase echA8 n=1 Tax=Paenactinomyces guangxiensis TaxID=1490290 RepID=A0A7W2A8S1_9BACL|nr:enoyl-CoA hydratase-related protein [Paenactinomyces guangxiensis]MBA4494915.1 enoyl-CoA hydratase/isomerase family protein [Paenactinomyces guangxiensis]MBH8591998.1 enoyl-CoA hydratase/isomerase family protein [Paenactinomyces guangxiensis]